MDLIKNYGSYENAKAELEKIKSTKYRNYMYLEEALLQYRRANNIFEVLDKVVYVDDFMHDEISVVSNIDDRIWLNNDAAVCIKDMVRHATESEIAAGHRL